MEYLQLKQCVVVRLVVTLGGALFLREKMLRAGKPGTGKK